MAAAMANWGVTVQLSHGIVTATHGQAQVSRSALAVVQTLTWIWRSFQNVDIELASMERWWSPNRHEPFTFECAQRLTRRLESLREPLLNIRAAPFVRMPVLAKLVEHLGWLCDELSDEDSFEEAGGLLLRTRYLATLLLLHRDLAQLMILPSRAQRWNRKMSDLERVEFAQKAERILRDLEDLDRSKRVIRADDGNLAYQTWVSVRYVVRAAQEHPVRTTDAYSCISLTLERFGCPDK